MPRRPLAALLLAAVLLPGSAAAGETLLGQELATPAPVLETRLDRLRELASRIRNLPWRRRVPCRVLAPARLPELLDRLFARETSPEEIRDEEEALKAFGLLPEDYDLVAGLKRLLGSEVAGFYEPEEEVVVLIDRPAGGAGAPAAPPEAQTLYEDTVLLHELVHALQDQLVGLEEEEGLGNDDRATARDALVEGDATAAMFDHLLGAPLYRCAPLAATLQQAFSQAENLLEQAALAGGEQELRAAPRVLRENLLFGYTIGFSFALGLRVRGGDGLLNRALAAPPVSSEQVLHPEKYLAPGRDDPRRLALAEALAGLVPAGRPASGTVGEWNIGILLREHGLIGAAAAAAGWDGDRFLVFPAAAPAAPGARPARLVVWASVWDTPADAVVFAAALSRVHRALFPGDAGLGLTAGGEVFASGDRVVCRGDRVALVLGAGSAAGALAEAALGAAESEKSEPYPTLAGLAAPAPLGPAELQALLPALQRRLLLLGTLAGGGGEAKPSAAPASPGAAPSGAAPAASSAPEGP